MARGWYWPCSGSVTLLRIAKGLDAVKLLTQELGETRATREEEASGSIQIGTELGEGSNLTVLGEVELQRTSELLHDLAVRMSDTRHDIIG